MTKDEALKLALEALEWSYGGEPMPSKELQAMQAIRQVLADNKGSERADKLKETVEHSIQELKEVVATLNSRRVWRGTRWEYSPMLADQYLPLRNTIDWQVAYLRSALAEWTPDDTSYRPDGLSMPVDRGAWSDVEDATKWVDDLRGDDLEPVAKVCPDLPQSIGWNPKLTQLPDEGRLLYTEPPKKEWVGLTDDEIFKADDRVPISIPKYKQLLVFGRILEVRLREKNNG